MIEQKSTGAISSKRQRLVVYLKSPDGHIHADIANLADNFDPIIFERRWGRPLFESESDCLACRRLLRVADALLSRNPEAHSLAQVASTQQAEGAPLEFWEESLDEKIRGVTLELRDVLRAAWRGDLEAGVKIQLLIQTGMHWSSSSKGELELGCDTLWAVPCILFLRDRAEGKLAVCANPDCGSYFVRNRNTQRFCDAAVCMVYSHKLSALNYWNAKGKKQRKKARRRG